MRKKGSEQENFKSLIQWSEERMSGQIGDYRKQDEKGITPQLFIAIEGMEYPMSVAQIFFTTVFNLKKERFFFYSSILQAK